MVLVTRNEFLSPQQFRTGHPNGKLQTRLVAPEQAQRDDIDR